jgi:heat shock protein HslJ
MRPLLAAVAVLALALTGCAAGSGTAPETEEATPMTDLTGEWQLTKASDADGSMPVRGVPVTLAVNGTDVAGQAPCNQYSGSIDLGDDGVAFGPLTRTKMACGEPRDALENRYLDALASVTESRLSGDELTLSGPDISLRFTLLEKKSVR